MRKITSDLLRQALTAAAASAAVLAAGFGGSHYRCQLSTASVRVAAPIPANAVSFPSAEICPAPMKFWGALSAQTVGSRGPAISASCATAAPTLPREAEPLAPSRTDLALVR